MSTALKIIPDFKNSANSASNRISLKSPDEKKVHTLGDSKSSRNARRLAMIVSHNTEDTDVFELLGWTDLPETLKNAIRPDLEAYRDELLGLYSTCDNGVRNRRKSVSYWVKAYRDGICTEETAAQSLTASFSV